MADSGKKQYGLIHSTKSAPGTFMPRPSIFGDDSASDEDMGKQGSSDWVKKAFQKEAEKSTSKKQTKINIQKALAEDPTIYQYDEVYDKLEEKKAESKLAKKDIEKKPKYITSLLAQAERRKQENERRMERQVQKEREEEGEEFKDKEAFVTAAYRAKLEEFKKQDEEEEYRDQLEAFTDVSKQKDLSGFYRHLYRQTVVGEDREKVETKDEDAKESTKDAESEKDVKDNQVGEKEIGEVVQSKKAVKEKAKRRYRKRRSSSSSSDSSKDNPDADSSLSDSSSSGSDKELNSSKKRKTVDKAELKPSKKRKTVDEADNVPVVKKEISLTEPDEDEKNEEEKAQNETPVVKEPKPKINIWMKRTVYAVFDEALARYLARKAARLQKG